MKDQFNREIDYMRISITDKCNLRCKYCMPEGVNIVPMSHLLTFEEIVEICTAAAALGIRKIKITGGEPLVRRGAPQLFGMLRKIPGIESVTLTTNGVLLKKYLPMLIENGLKSVNISLDTMDRALYEKMTGQDVFPQVMESIHAAVDAGLQVKINTVLLQGMNENSWQQLVEYARAQPVDIRFIEIMPIGAGEAFSGVSNDTLLGFLKEKYPDIKKDLSVHGNGPAAYYSIPGFIGGIGFISAMHGKFCSQCNRIRMSAQGEIKPCLCYGTAIDLRQALRSRGLQKKQAESGQSHLQLQKLLQEAIYRKPQAHCFDRKEEITEKKKMVSIGG